MGCTWLSGSTLSSPLSLGWSGSERKITPGGRGARLGIFERAFRGATVEFESTARREVVFAGFFELVTLVPALEEPSDTEDEGATDSMGRRRK